MAWVRNYWLPIVLALLVHVAAGALVLRGWTPTATVAEVVRPQVVNASLIVVQPSRKPLAQSPAKPKPVPVTEVAPTRVRPPDKQQQPSAAEKPEPRLIAKEQPKLRPLSDAGGSWQHLGRWPMQH